MNVLSRKLRELENNILDFPPEDDDILLQVGDVDEQLLHDRAQKIRSTFRDDAQAIVESKKSPEQQNEAAKQLLCRLTDQENDILEQSHEFLTYRVERLLYKWFAASYPKGEDERVMLRVIWFFREMQKFNNACLIEDYEWNNNRNEDDPSFDDNSWWNAVDAKTKDLLYVQKLLGHRNIKTTLRYTQLLTLPQNEEYICKAAKTIEEATQLIEAGFQYVTEVNEAKLFKKLKTSYLGT